MKTITVNFQVELPIEIKQRKKWVLASCPVLDIHSQGETAAKAKKNLAEALRLFITSCFERGILEEVLKECGFRPTYEYKPERRRSIASREDYINIPIPFVIQNGKSKSGCQHNSGPLEDT
ncbi:MAG TPA: hypothetical protein PLG17_12605 [Thermodesulfobacteriota bacterium]|nr:hypothetical protein [Thermodesulfobacteriota bacterium]HQO79338.1 hypothetical protein [Thermodesulfobacteriota bacterium]